MFPLGLNFNNQITSNFQNVGFNCVTMPDLLQVFNLNGLSNFDSFSNSMINTELQRQNEFFMLLSLILSNPNINHTPTIDLDGFIRPYDYNKYNTNGDKIKTLEPNMQEKTMQLLDYAKEQGLKVQITSAYRTPEEQKELQRTRGKYAAKNSAHCEGKAIDIKIVGGSDADYKKLGDYAKSIGMRWGGDFSVKERWHFDIRQV